jgi:hypothetical protein
MFISGGHPYLTSLFCRIELGPSKILRRDNNWWGRTATGRQHQCWKWSPKIRYDTQPRACDVTACKNYRYKGTRARKIASNCEGMTIGGLELPEEGITSAGSGVRRSGVTRHHVLVMSLHARTIGTRAGEISSNCDNSMVERS